MGFEDTKGYAAYDMANGMTYIGYRKTGSTSLEDIVVTNTVPHLSEPGSEVLNVREHYKGIYREIANSGKQVRSQREPVSKFEDKCIMVWYLGSDILEE